MKIETFKIHKTDATVSLVPSLKPDTYGIKKKVAFYIRGEYFRAQKANNLFNRTLPALPPRIPKGPFNRIMNDDFENGDIVCFVIDRGADIEIIIE